MVHDLEKRVQAAKNNVESMSQLMTKWSEAPLYERKEGKKEGLLNLEVKKHQHLVQMVEFVVSVVRLNFSLTGQ